LEGWLSFDIKELKAVLEKNDHFFSCLDIANHLPSTSQIQYLDILNTVKNAAANEKKIFSWRGIETNDSGIQRTSFKGMAAFSELLSKRTLELLELEQFEDDASTPDHLSMNYEDFQKFLFYLIECVEQEAGALAQHFEEQEDEQFAFLPLQGDWGPHAGNRFMGFVPPKAKHAGLLNRLAAIDAGASIVFGYPVERWELPRTHEDIPPGATIKPIFQIKVAYDPVSRCFSTNSPNLEINPAWLNQRLTRMQQKKAFLAACGPLELNRDDEQDFGTIDQPLDHLIMTLSTILPQFVKEPLITDYVQDHTLNGRKSGIYNRAVIMIARKGRYVNTLVSELKQILTRPQAELSSTALGALFSENNPRNRIPNNGKPFPSLLEMLPMNTAQRRAILSLMKKKQSVITGPPGTGKSQVAAATMANLRLRNQSVLFTSKNHKAIDAVMDRLKVEDGRAYVVRANSKEDPNLKITFQKVIKLLLECEYDPAASEKCEALLKEADKLAQNRNKIEQILITIDQKAGTMAQYEELAAMHALHLSKSFCKTISEKPDAFPENWICKLEKIVADLQKSSWLYHWRAHIRLFSLRCKRHVKNYQLPDLPLFSYSNHMDGKTSLEKDLVTLHQMLDFSQALKKSKTAGRELTSLFDAQKNNVDGLYQTIGEISSEIQKITRKILPLDLSARSSGLPAGDERERLANLLAALGLLSHGLLDEHTRQDRLQRIKDDIQLLLRKYPCWAVTNLSVGSRLPLVAGMFDLAILDEASQCDMASAIPVLYRARRVGIIGDPFQLRHIAHLSPSQDEMIRNSTGFYSYSLSRYSYADTSLYGLFVQSGCAEPVFLDETYRSHAQIAGYSNDVFYHHRLRVAVDPHKLTVPAGMRPGLHWTCVEGDIISGGPSGCHSLSECDMVVKLTTELLQNDFHGTIGIVTPFHQQANRINDQLYETGIPQEIIDRTRLYVDTSHGFQGDERDIIFFSLCAGPDMPRGSFHFLKDQGHLFNVAVSRARAVLHVVGNKDWAQSCDIRHIRKLAQERNRETSRPRGPWYPYDSPWEKVLYEALVAQDLSPKIQYPVAGRRLDMALIREGDDPLKLDIEVDGDRYHRNPDGSRKQADIWRDYQLRGLGWKIKRFWVYQLREDLQKCVNSILEIWRHPNDSGQQ
jgi:very-short-patch-repair endonuclease